MSLLSCLALAVLGPYAWLRARGAAARERRLRDDRCRRRLEQNVRRLLLACRRSSDAVLAAIEESLREAEPSIDCVLFFAARGDALVCRRGAGARAAHLPGLSVRVADETHLVARAAATKCRAAAPREGAPILPTDRCAIAMPMLDARTLHGVVYAASSTCERFADPDALVGTVALAAEPYAIAVEREADRADATHDGLTGLLTPRAFRLTLQNAVAAAAARGTPVSVWFVDTDRFKAVNDTFGHRAGDAVLQTMASLLAAHLAPDADVAARNGGDEFCALLRAPKAACIERARRFAEAVRSHDFGIPIRVTASVGVAAYPHDAASWSALLEIADAAMYHSKRSGRDLVSFAVEPNCYACVEAEAAPEPSRSFSRWLSSGGEGCFEASPG